MTENPTGVNAAVAQGEVQSGTQEAVTPQVTPAAQEIDLQARARKEQIDAVTASLRREYTRMGLQIDEKRLSREVQNLVVDKIPVSLSRELNEGDVDGGQTYLSSGEKFPIPQLGINEISKISELLPIIPGARLDPTRLDRRIVTWLMRASQTPSKIPSPDKPNCIGISSVIDVGNNIFCELDTAAGVVRMTQNIGTMNADGTYTDTKRRIAWVYDKKLFTQLEEAAQEWAKQEKLWQHACKIVGIDPSTTGYVVDRTPDDKKTYFLVRSSDGERVDGLIRLKDNEGKAADYMLTYLPGRLMLVSSDPEKAELVRSAVDQRNWPADIAFDA